MSNPASSFPHKHLLGIEGLSRFDILHLLELSEQAIEVSRQVEKKKTRLSGRTQINLFFEASTRTQSSFELAGKRLGADVMNMSVATSSVKKGETLIDTAITLNAMRPDIIVVRHNHAGAIVAYDDDVRAHRVQGDRRIDQRLALFDAGGRHRHVHHVGAEAFSSQFERRLGPRRGLE